MNWIHKWLPNRRQRVVVDGEVSIGNVDVNYTMGYTVFTTFKLRKGSRSNTKL